MIYRAAQLLVRAAWPALGRLEVEGLDRVPRHGPFILIANHQSYLDPILVQAVLPRPLHTMAKSTQFNSHLIGAIMKRLKSFPVRRFEIDPQAVRHSLRLLANGEAVGVYIEGERTWDGRLQPLRRGTVRLILKAAVPVIPCGVSGAYDVWPRWDRRLRRGTVRLRFGEPMLFSAAERRADRERAVDEAAARIMDTLAELSGSVPGPW
jgi:1-acyl-sn-glycerol-3-phosphate acyltransferase